MVVFGTGWNSQFVGTVWYILVRYGMNQSFSGNHCSLGCALFSKFLGLNAVLVELDDLSSGKPSFLKSDHGKLLRIAILCLVTWVSRGTCVMVS